MTRVTPVVTTTGMAVPEVHKLVVLADVEVIGREARARDSGALLAQ